MPKTPTPAVSSAATREDKQQPQQAASAVTSGSQPQEMGNVPSLDQAGESSQAASPARDYSEINSRLHRMKQWEPAMATKDAIIAECRAKGMSPAAAKAYAYEELDRLYPPKGVEAAAKRQPPAVLNGSNSVSPDAASTSERGVKGLSDIPPAWGDLPASASLAADIGWVQANRLLVTEEKANGSIVVNLSKARTSAPSWSALSWLETSIRSYAKFVEVAAKQASSGEDEAQFVRRERMQIEEIRALLREMMPTAKG